jgi:hypothetical protein
MIPNLCLAGAILSFATATYIDRPWTPTTHAQRMTGNFCCSLGFLLLAISLVGR